MKQKHTPGPWHVAKKVSNYVVARDGLDIIAQCDTMGEETREVENANARLIAAAPDLLAALEDMLNDAFAPFFDDATIEQRNYRSEMLRIAASSAIAKARGK